MQKRFNALRIISTFFKFVSILIVIGSALGFVFALNVAITRLPEFYPTNVSNGYAWVLASGALGLFIGLFLAVLVCSAGLLIDVVLTIEEHSRAAATLSRRAITEARRRDADQEAAARPQKVRPLPPPKSAPLPNPAPIRSVREVQAAPPVVAVAQPPVVQQIRPLETPYVARPVDGDIPPTR